MRWLVFALAVALFVGGFVLAWRDMTTAAIPTYGGGVICLIFAWLSRFKKFKGFGVDAELWEDKQEQAADLIDRLRSLAGSVARPVLAMAPRMGRLGQHLSRRELHDFVSTLETTLREAGLAEHEISRIKRDYHYITMFELVRVIDRALQPRVLEKLQELRKQHDDIPRPTRPEEHDRHQALIDRQNSLSAAFKGILAVAYDIPIEQIPDELEARIAALPEYTEDEIAALMSANREELEDIRFYAHEKAIRRLSHWLDSDDD